MLICFLFRPSCKLKCSIIFQLRADLSELTKLSQLAERQKVKDIFLIEIRKIETEITKLQDACKMEIDGDSGGVQPKKIVAPAQNRCYDVKLTNYGKFFHSLLI